MSSIGNGCLSSTLLWSPATGSAFFFFFSSRRRHTRWPRDWSSDVCSSDLDCPKSSALTISCSIAPLGEGMVAFPGPDRPAPGIGGAAVQPAEHEVLHADGEE